jgi:hypothetical protein
MPISFVGVSPSSWLDGSGKSRAPDRSLKMDKTAFHAAAFLPCRLNDRAETVRAA